MEARAHSSYVPVAPRKVQIVCDLIRGQDVRRAAAILMATPKIASEYLGKVLKSAVANAENNHGMDAGNLYVSEVFATSGPKAKRVRPRAQGRAFRVEHKSSHITIVVKEKE